MWQAGGGSRGGKEFRVKKRGKESHLERGNKKAGAAENKRGAKKKKEAPVRQGGKKKKVPFWGTRRKDWVERPDCGSGELPLLQKKKGNCVDGGRRGKVRELPGKNLCDVHPQRLLLFATLRNGDRKGCRFPSRDAIKRGGQESTLAKGRRSGKRGTEGGFPAGGKSVARMAKERRKRFQQKKRRGVRSGKKRRSIFWKKNLCAFGKGVTPCRRG